MQVNHSFRGASKDAALGSNVGSNVRGSSRFQNFQNRLQLRELWWMYALLLAIVGISFVPAPVWLKMLAYAMQNGFEVIGTSTSIVGALMLAMKSKYSAWAWPLWIVSNLAWMAYAFQLPSPGLGLIVQNLVFAGINILGTWRWLVSPCTSPCTPVEKKEKNR
jgi:hypothetical protein